MKVLESKLLQRVDLDKSHIVSDPLTCDLTLFPTKIAQIVQKVIVFFPEKREETKH